MHKKTENTVLRAGSYVWLSFTRSWTNFRVDCVLTAIVTTSSVVAGSLASEKKTSEPTPAGAVPKLRRHQ